MTYEEAVDYLEALGPGIKPDLSRIEALVELLNHPERTYPSIQIAGTNGKSSTARIIGKILGAHGIATGIYLSPHLQSVRERFLLVDEYIAPEEFAETVEYLSPFVDQVEGVTYHELATAIAFEWMSNKAIGAGVFETGMGGTWDATNVADSTVAVLTPIDVDHVEYLGPTALDNAREKVGIISNGASVVSAPQRPDVSELIDKTVADRGAELVEFKLISNETAVGGRQIAIEGAHSTYNDLFLSLLGSHQGLNAAAAVAAVEAFLGTALDMEALRTSLASVESPGRLEVVRRNPLVILDGAHNPHGAQTLGPSLLEAFGTRRRTFVVSVFADKDIDGILREIVPYADRLIFTSSGHERSADPKELALRTEGEVIAEMPDAIDTAVADAAKDEMVVVTGSLWGIGVAREHLQ